MARDRARLSFPNTRRCSIVSPALSIRRLLIRPMWGRTHRRGWAIACPAAGCDTVGSKAPLGGLDDRARQYALDLSEFCRLFRRGRRVDRAVRRALFKYDPAPRDRPDTWEHCGGG